MQGVKMQMSMVVAELAQIHDEMSFLIKKRGAGIREMAQHCSVRTGVLILVPESGSHKQLGSSSKGYITPCWPLGAPAHTCQYTHIIKLIFKNKNRQQRRDV